MANNYTDATNYELHDIAKNLGEIVLVLREINESLEESNRLQGLMRVED